MFASLFGGDSPLRVLKNRNYRLYFAGQLMSVSGNWMQSVAQSWLVYRLTQSGYWLGIITFSVHMMAFVFSPVAGVVADQRDRRKILIVVQTVAIIQAFLLGALVLSGHVVLTHVVILAALLGCVNAFDMTTRHTFSIDLVGKTELSSAIVLNSVVINLSRIIGPVLAGFLIGVVGEGWCFILNGLSCVPVLVGLLTMKINRPIVIKKTGANNSLFGNMLEGLSYTLRHRIIFRLMLVSAGVCLVASPFVVLLPLFAEKVLGGGASTLGWLTSALGAGAVVGALGASRAATSSGIRKQLVVYVTLWGVGLALMGLSSSVPLSLLAMAFIGYCMMNVFPTLNNTIQQMVDDSMRGRVVALYTMTFLGTMPLGSLALGWLSDHYGAAAVTIGMGTITMLIGASLMLILDERFQFTHAHERVT